MCAKQKATTEVRRPSQRGRAAAAAALQRLDHARAKLSPWCAPAGASCSAASEPGPNEAFFGQVRAVVPDRAEWAALYRDGHLAERRRATSSTVLVSDRPPLGQHDIEIRFEAKGQVVSRARSRGVWPLPASASAAPAPPRHDETLEDGLIRLVNGFQHYAAVWYRDLTSGRSALCLSECEIPRRLDREARRASRGTEPTRRQR